MCSSDLQNYPQYGVQPPQWTRSSDKRTLTLVAEVPIGTRLEVTSAMLDNNYNYYGSTGRTLTMTTTVGACTSQLTATSCPTCGGNTTAPTAATVSTNLTSDLNSAGGYATYTPVNVGSATNTVRIVGRGDYGYYNPWYW